MKLDKSKIEEIVNGVLEDSKNDAINSELNIVLYKISIFIITFLKCTFQNYVLICTVWVFLQTNLDLF